MDQQQVYLIIPWSPLIPTLIINHVIFNISTTSFHFIFSSRSGHDPNISCKILTDRSDIIFLAFLKNVQDGTSSSSAENGTCVTTSSGQIFSRPSAWVVENQEAMHYVRPHFTIHNLFSLSASVFLKASEQVSTVIISYISSFTSVPHEVACL